MAETLDTLGEKIAALTTSVGEMRKQLNGHDQQFVTIGEHFKQVDTRLDGIDKRFEQVDTRFDELGSSVRTLIEGVDSKVDLVLEKVSHLMTRDIHNSDAHARSETRLDDHELRLLALETGARAPSSTDPESSAS